ncbi:hypothetical protein D9M68_621030 [compost metagenome]
MAWREPPADQKVDSSNRISSVVMPLQGATRLSPLFFGKAPVDRSPGEGEY